MTHSEKILSCLKNHGKILEVVKLDDIPKTDYIYTVINGDNVLQIGKSSHGNKGRLKLVFEGSILGKHNKAFICGLYPSIVNTKNKYYAISLSNLQDKSKVEIDIHSEMGIKTNVEAATFIDEITNEGIPKFHLILWERFKKHRIYKKMDSIEKLMALELYELVTFGTSRITRSSGKVMSSKQADNLEGNILKCLDKRYLTTIWLMMCNNYYRYGNAHSISKSEFKTMKEQYQYQEYGVPFRVFGESR